MGDGIIFLNNYRVFRGVLKGDGVIFARRQINLLGIGLLDGIAGGGFQFLDLVPARFLPLQVNFPLGVGVKGAQVVVFASLGIIRTAPDLPVMLSTFLMNKSGLRRLLNSRVVVLFSSK